MAWDRAFAFAGFPNVAAGLTGAERRLANLRRIAWLMDNSVGIPGTRFRFGLNSLVGFTPAVGDAVLVAVSLYIVHEARKLGLPREKLMRMMGNVVIEGVAGMVPVVGDLFDMTFKANLRNLAIIEEHVRGRA